MSNDGNGIPDHFYKTELPINQNSTTCAILDPQLNEPNELRSAHNNTDISSFDSDSEEDYYITTSNSTLFGHGGETQELEKPSLVPNKLRFKSIDFLLSSLDSAMNSLEFDKALVIQSQVAGNVNGASSDIQKSIESLQEELKVQINKYNTLKSNLLPEIEANIKKSRKRIKKINSYIQSKYPVEYSKGRTKILDNLTEDEEGIFL